MKKIFKIFLIIFIINCLTISLFSCKKDNDSSKDEKENISPYVTFGEYPQTYVSDLSVEDVKKYSYDPNTNYYSNNDKKYAILKAKPFRLDSSSVVKFLDGTIIEDDKEYVFLVEPIKWIVLSNAENTRVRLISNDILDVEAFNPKENIYFDLDRYYIKNSSTIYANNWEYSYVRKYLNENFYNRAFSALEQKKMYKVFIDNKKSIFGNSDYTSRISNTVDFVFLISRSELDGEYGKKLLDSSGNMKLKNSSDYAVCKGLFYDKELRDEKVKHPSGWITRTPAKKDGDLAQLIYSISSSGVYNRNQTAVVSSYEKCGLCPVIEILK